MQTEIINKCISASKQIRIDCINMTKNTGNTGAHIGGALSSVEILSVLYNAILKFDKNNLRSESRDRFIFSKGHCAMVQYAAMKSVGLLTDNDLLTYKANGSKLSAHPSMNLDIGIEFSSGSLGQGLSLGVGTALALKRKNNNESKVYVLIGDGECNEGQIWEAAMSASAYHLDNLVVIIDKNKLQYDGLTIDVLDSGSLSDKFKSFGFETKNIDGHSINELLESLNIKTDKSMAIIANTIKGKGISFMENNPLWHNNRLTNEQYAIAMNELGVNI